jgi:SAM-dependent methyltransferase
MPDHWYENYERGRPGYPREAVGVAALPPTATVADLGAGTGKLTRMLLSEFERVVAVEPDDGMSRLLIPLCPEAEVLEGSAEDIPLEDSSVDGVFISEAFHNFDGERALSEIARVLRSHGALILLWNVPAGPTTPSIASVERLLDDRSRDHADISYDPKDLNADRFASGAWRASFIGAPFEELREVRLRNPQTIGPDGLTAFFGSMGWIADLPEPDRRSLLTDVRSGLTADTYTRSWETRAFWTRVTPPSATAG